MTGQSGPSPVWALVLLGVIALFAFALWSGR
jgi:hypothetical protein